MKNKKNKIDHECMSTDLRKWCQEQADLYFAGKLEQSKIDMLNSINFPWDEYKREYN